MRCRFVRRRLEVRRGEPAVVGGLEGGLGGLEGRDDVSERAGVVGGRPGAGKGGGRASDVVQRGYIPCRPRLLNEFVSYSYLVF